MESFIDFNTKVNSDIKEGKLPFAFTNVVLKEKINALTKKREPNYLAALATSGVSGACDYAFATQRMIQEKMKEWYSR